MLSLKAIFSVLAFSALASAAPTELQIKSQFISPLVTVCIGSLDPRDRCIDIAITSTGCINFIGGFSGLNDEVSNGQVPLGFVCTFFANFGCLSLQDDDALVLPGGKYSFFKGAPGPDGTFDFNDMISSISCSPVSSCPTGRS
ncbi:hypothetical protein BDZ94DRAFT_1304921 [Collybia nuda]|uniref:Uncharacterized protein n=1 Tax=Collybia nuda TaxID=64659 RepID=A0A9P5YGG6_9AGAR|nr:hypothetical protein BDZ94DRAFT_1304921 [Collybia nuda]